MKERKKKKVKGRERKKEIEKERNVLYSTVSVLGGGGGGLSLRGCMARGDAIRQHVEDVLPT